MTIPTDIYNLILEFTYGQYLDSDVKAMISIIKCIESEANGFDELCSDLSHYYKLRLNKKYLRSMMSMSMSHEIKDDEDNSTIVTTNEITEQNIEQYIHCMVEELIRMHIDKLNDECWDIICYRNDISESFYDDYIDNIDKNYFQKYICSDNHISEEFFIKHMDRIDKACWYYLYYNIGVSDKFLMTYMPKLDQFDWSLLSSYELDEDEIELYKDVSDCERFYNLYVNLDDEVEFYEENYDIQDRDVENPQVYKDHRLCNLISLSLLKM